MSGEITQGAAVDEGQKRRGVSCLPACETIAAQRIEGGRFDRVLFKSDVYIMPIYRSP